MKWIGCIEHKNFKEVAIIKYNGQIYNIEKYRVFSDGSKEDIGNGIWGKTLRGAKRAINLDTGYKAKDWNWKEETKYTDKV